MTRKGFKESVFFALFIIVIHAFPIAQVVIGINYWDQEKHCPGANLGLLLVVGGCLHLVPAIRCIFCRTPYADDADDDDEPPGCLMKLLAVAEIAWVIIGSVIVFELYPRVTYNTVPGRGEDYCNVTLFRLVLWQVSAMLAFMVFGAIFLVSKFCKAVLCLR
jgi:hypothetical protein